MSPICVRRALRPPGGDVAELGHGGHEVREEDVARLSPLKHKHLNVLGKYAFTASQPAGGLGPLRDADGGFAPEDLDDE